VPKSTGGRLSFPIKDIDILNHKGRLQLNCGCDCLLSIFTLSRIGNMVLNMKKFIVLMVLTVMATALLFSWNSTPFSAAASTVDSSSGKPDDEEAALKRARKQAKMLDTLYKTAIVVVTKNYVDESSDLAAGDAFQLLFQSMKEGGFHEVRLLDASGEAIDDENLPQDDFEKAAVKAMLDGKELYEQTFEKDGKRFLKSVTPIPVVMEKCIMCHENYKGKKIIGALGITLEIE
jgi:Protein of unknown function (DUF3365)